MFELFNDNHARAFAHHETVTVFIKGARCVSRIVIAAAQSVHIVKASYTHRANTGIGAARYHHVGVATADNPTGFTDSVQAGRTGSHVCNVGALQTEHNRELSGDHIDDRPGNHKGRNTTGTAFMKCQIVVADHAQAADTGTDRAADAGEVFFFKIKTGITDGLNACGHPVVHIAVITTGFLGGKIVFYIEVFDFAGDLATHTTRIKMCNRADTVLAGQSILPTGLHIVTDRANHT